MFYSQIILAKKGPLGKIWQAAHWGDKKLGRPAVFSTDIETAVDHIVDPAIPLALRVSSHLLWGVVRIYSRQVQYLLDDCQQAMTKVSFVNQHASKASSNAKIDLNVSKQQMSHLNVSNFAEHVPTGGGIVEFAIPFMEETDEADWVPAELPDEELHIPEPQDDNEFEMHDDHEQWGGVEFDPDDENATDSTGSIEKPREAQSVNQSDILKNVDTSNEISRNIPTEEDAGDFPVNDDFLPFDDDGDMAAPPPAEDSSLMGSGMADITNSNDHSNASLNIGFGDSPVQDEATKKRKTQSARKAKKKRRKIITDSSELSSDHIREMLEDTSPTLMTDAEREPPKPKRTMEERFYHPCMEDGGLLPDAVLAIWKRNMTMVLGKGTDYEMDDGTADDDAVEIPRDAAAEDTDMLPQEDSFPVDSGDAPPDDDMIPFDDDPPPMMDDSMPPPDMPHFSDDDDDRSVFSLGATNDLQDDIEIDEPVGSTKWHKNTVKVFEVLKHNLKEKDVVSFQVLSKSSTRRTAAGLFFEMLQLKTLNYIEIDQNQSFGDIQITQGVRFEEDIST